MGLEFTWVFDVAPRVLFLFVSDAVPVMPSQHVIRTCSEDGILGRVATSPDLTDNVLCMLWEKEFLDRVLGNQIEGIPVLEVFFKK